MEITNGNASIRINPFTNPELSDDECAKIRFLSHLYIPEEHRRKGEANKLLEKVTKEASDAGLTLIVEPKPYEGDMPLDALIKLYTKHGFVKIQDEPLLMMKNPNVHI